jgi:hypothetical protein
MVGVGSRAAVPFSRCEPALVELRYAASSQHMPFANSSAAVRAVIGAFLLVVAAESVPVEAAPACPVLALNGSTGHAVGTDTIYPTGSALASFTVEAWVNPTFMPSGNQIGFIASDDAYSLGYRLHPSGTMQMVFSVWGPGNTNVTFLESGYGGFWIQQWNHVAAVFDANTRQARVFVNGVAGPARTVDLDTFGIYSDTFTVGALSSAGPFLVNGYIDDLRVSTVARYSATFVPPDALAVDGFTAALYRFSEPSTATTFANAAGSEHALAAQGGAHSENTAGCSPSAAPVIVAQPSSGALCMGVPVLLRVEATGTPPLSYQWFSSFGGPFLPIAGATESTYLTSPFLPMEGGVFRVRVANAYGSVDSEPAYLAVVPFNPVMFVQQPASRSIAAGQSMALTVVVSDTPPTFYQWFTGRSGDTTNPIAGAASPQYTTPPLTSTTEYWVRVSNACGPANSRTAVIRVWTDYPLAAGVVIKRTHVEELRSQIDRTRLARGLPAFGWTDPTLVSGVTLVKTVHFDELRTALAQAYAAAGGPPPTYTDTLLTIGATPVRVPHLAELRAAIEALDALP